MSFPRMRESSLMKLRKGDTVLVTTGKDKGKKGKVEKTFPALGSVVVPGVNVYKRHKKKQGEGKAGGIIEITKPIAVSKVVLVCPKCNLPTRVGYLVTGREKERICRKCQQKL